MLPRRAVADGMAALVQQAIRSNRTPRHFVSDQGSQFIAEIFRPS
jgi:hypothetical protein